MKKYLRCHTESGNSPITIGKNYEIRKEYVDDDGDLCYEIRTDEGRLEDFTAYPDKDGDSYLNWFTLETDEQPRKIDGRKAEITRPGHRFSTYKLFAVKYGYPDAAADCDSKDTRRKPQQGDIVTLLVSGVHHAGYRGETIWIVEAADGERYIIGEKGLRILSEELSGVTVLKDETLGGVEREYREVRRKAAVGERIKIVAKGFSYFDLGEIVHVDAPGLASNSVRAVGDGLSQYVEDSEYVVIEKTDIIRIDDLDGVNRGYRMVDRKAAVGERVIVVDAAATNGTYRNGFVLSVVSVLAKGGVEIDKKGRDMVSVLWRSEYRVLEPVESAKSAEPTAPLSAQPPLDQAAATISALTAKVQALESRVDTLEMAKQAVKVAEGPADDMPPSFADMPRAKSLQQIRDEIVERAKADVKRLERLYGIKFVVNRDKRTVVALQVDFDKDRVVDRAIAKCAPDDVFNSHIGKAIAARRLLWFDIPAEYLSVPNPEEPRVGDVVKYGPFSGSVYAIRPKVRTAGEEDIGAVFIGSERGLTFMTTVHSVNYELWAPIAGTIIIDDSREEVSA